MNKRKAAVTLLCVIVFFVCGILYVGCGSGRSGLELSSSDGGESPGTEDADSDDTLGASQAEGSGAQDEESSENTSNSSDTAGDGTQESSGTGEAESGEDEKICVFVSGAVVSSGVYFLEQGSRCYEALAAAGGFTEDACADYLNLAKILSDEEQLYVPTNAEVSQGYSGSGESAGFVLSTSGGDGTVNINTASLEELMTLSGIGESKAQAIIDYREENGSFENAEDIQNVSGIGEATYENIKDYIRI